jgi:hypothetical protein
LSAVNSLFWGSWHTVKASFRVTKAGAMSSGREKEMLQRTNGLAIIAGRLVAT